MTPIDKVLTRLEKVKPDSKDHRWKACCPAHNDKSPSLRITETEDGTVLLKCWVGCSAAEIVGAIGLELRDLFPGEKRERSGPSPAAIRHERAVYQIGKSLLDQGQEMSAEDLERFNLAKQRLGVE
ncbi:virulence-associated protein E [Pseudomonas aeruginosa]|uniref:virulence-associated protein E n=1 Tax=Pseudomonas aeruginosa TaxID=287 RepID=UPI002B25B56D|nr:virulence-associated protein E [Pseudomonas aeruginosa]WOX95349.1 virulence-associated protein E [Pseudomonas aeruginosa]HBN8651919.1 virulence-associated protein E [Pseudomonas aeruginosa]HCE0322395.1 virulence-associated protein E [Pseudomonas aeruginosa]HCE3951679.1 virulence-associated protein E [Pseudomonas aeruginosa]